jgi:hypothetical protein
VAYRPTNELVTVAWLKGLSGLNNLVATDLPTDASTWVASGFTQVTAVGGIPAAYFALANPVVTLDFWAVAPDSGKPPWNKANQLAETARMGLLDHASVGRLLVLPAAYDNARVLTCRPLIEPRKVRNDEAGYARYSMDVEFSWVAVPK